MILRAFFDDSGDGQGAKIAAIGGAVGTYGQWLKFDQRWKHATRKLDGPFHATDCEARQGCCKGWTVPERNAMMQQAVSAILSSGLQCLGAYVGIQDYADAFPGAAPHEPYSLIFGHMVVNMAVTAEQGEALGYNCEAHLWHESSRRDARLTGVFQSFRDLNTWHGSKFLLRVSFGPKYMRALQAADLIARETFKHADNQGTLREVRIPVRRLIERIRFFPWDRACLNRLKSYGDPTKPMTLIKCMMDKPPRMTMKRWPK